MTFVWPLALLGLLAIPVLAALYVLAGRRRRRDARAVRQPRARPESRLVVAGLAPPRRARARAGRAGAPRGRDRATARRAQRHARRRDDRARDRHLALDGRRRRRADPLPGGEAGRTRVPRRGARQLQRGHRLVLDVRRPGAAADDRPRGGEDRARPAPARARGRRSGTRSRARSTSRSTSGPAERPRPRPGPGERSPAAVLLLSDGAQTAGDIRPLPAAQRARRLGVPVSTVALGTGDAVVEVPRPGGLKERVVVAPDVPTLRRVAQTTGGSFSEAPDARQPPVRLPRARHAARARPQARRGDLGVRRGRRRAAARRQHALVALVPEGPVSRPRRDRGRDALVIAFLAGAERRPRRRRVQGPADLPAGHRPLGRDPRAAARRRVDRRAGRLRCPLRGYIVAGIDARVSDRAIDVSDPRARTALRSRRA